MNSGLQFNSGHQQFENTTRFGEALAAADFNGDGNPDLAIGIPNHYLSDGQPTDFFDREGAGAVWVVYGAYGGLATNVYPPTLVHQTIPTHGFEYEPGFSQQDLGYWAETDDFFGSALAAGDFNNDGYADLAVGVPSENPSHISPSIGGAGAVNVIFGTDYHLDYEETFFPIQTWSQGDLGMKGFADQTEYFGAALGQ